MKKTGLLLLILLSIFSTFSQTVSKKSIHQIELEHYKSIGVTAEEYYDINKPAQITHSEKSKSCNLNKIVFGWHPYWSNGLEDNYDWNLISDLSYFSYEVNASTGNASNTNSWETAPVIDIALANGVRVNLCVTLFDNHATFFSSSTAQQTLIDNLISMVQSRGANGVNIDFEGVSSTHRIAFTEFLISLCNQMHSQIPGSQVSLCLYAVDWSDLFQEDIIDQHIDYYTIMGYDYYYSGSEIAGPTSPLYTFGNFNYNLARSVSYYINEGASKDKLILGLPYYGFEWNTTSENIPSATTSYVSARTYKTVKNNLNGYYSNRQWDPVSLSPYYSFNVGNWRQCFIDDEESLSYRYDLVNLMDIAGIGIWALGYDDGYTQLWQLIYEKLTDCNDFPCSGTLYDLGGPNNNYYNNSHYTVTIAPSGASQVSLEFTEFDIEAGSGQECNYDYIEIFDGENTAATSFGKFCNTTGSPGTINSSGNALTLLFHSDGATINNGFTAEWNCVLDNTPPITQINTGNWQSEDFVCSFTDTDNINVNKKYYQVLDFDNNEWRANSNYGFFNDNFGETIHSEWTNISGNWSIDNGVLKQSDEAATNPNIYASVTQTAEYDYLYQWQMKLSGSGDNRRAGIYFFCSDPELTQRGNSYMIYLRADQNNCQIYKSTDNNIVLCDENEVNINPDVWYDYKISYSPISGTMKVFQNNILIASWTDLFPLIEGNSISLRSGNCIAYYDDIKVYKNRDNEVIVSIGENNEVRYQNSNQSTPACRITSIINDDYGNFSEPASFNVNIDTTPPENISIVFDGLDLDIDTSYNSTSLCANWNEANEPNSFIEYYEYCIGTNQGTNNIVDWTNNLTQTSATHTGLNLVNETYYYFSVRAVNNLGLKSQPTSSDGIVFIDPTWLQNNSENVMTIHPNPFSSHLIINATDQTPKLIYIYDKSGKVLASLNTNEKYIRINTSNYPAGIYFLQVLTDFKNTVQIIIKE
jgi:spore germination protein YaaH